MLSLRNRFGIPGVISVIALVFAMLGGAYAASDNSGSGKATASAKAKKAKKGPRGPRGPKGPAGPAGPQGPAGPAGAKGDKGDTGAAGSNGSNGAVGPTGPTGKTGATGAAGKEGESGFTEVLPPGETEKGAWAFGGITEAAIPEGALRVPISFNIPLADDLGEAEVHVINQAGKEVKGFFATEEVTSTACTGSVTNPTAAPGHLCVYTAQLQNAKISNSWIKDPASEAEAEGANAAGAVLAFFALENGAFGFGTWAVRAEEA